MFGRLLPRETSFFDFFEQHAALTVRAAREMVSIASLGTDIPNRARRIKDLEHEADAVTHCCMQALHKTFITPIERNDIHRLISRLDDILDLIDGAARRLVSYELSPGPPGLQELTQVVLRSANAVQRAVGQLRNMKNAGVILRECVEINQLENEADLVHSNAVARLFKEQADPIDVIKWREIYDRLERATDRCEDVADILEGIVLEHD